MILNSMNQSFQLALASWFYKYDDNLSKGENQL